MRAVLSSTPIAGEPQLQRGGDFLDLGSSYGFDCETNGVDLSQSLEALKRFQSTILFLLQRNQYRLQDGQFIAMDFYNVVQRILDILPPDSAFYQNQIDMLPNEVSKRAIVDLTINLLTSNFPVDDSGFPETVPSLGSDITMTLKVAIPDGESFHPGRVIIPSAGPLNQSINAKLARDIKNILQTIISTWMLYLINLHRKGEIKRLDLLANYDSLTGLGNRRSLFSEILPGEETFYLMIDIDHFKKINDMYGHPVGDIVLQKLSSTLRDICGEYGAKIYRFGGEEFTVTGVGDKSTAQALTQKILETVRGMKMCSDGLDNAITITVSIGGILYDSCKEGIRTLDDLIKSADKALYISKENGRDRVSFYSSTPEELMIHHSNVRER